MPVEVDGMSYSDLRGDARCQYPSTRLKLPIGESHAWRSTTIPLVWRWKSAIMGGAGNEVNGLSY